jgi:hypothetical protein
VREQNQLGRQHRTELAEIGILGKRAQRADPALDKESLRLSQERLSAIARAVFHQSFTLHNAIGIGRWYHKLKLAIAENNQDLDGRLFWVEKHPFFWRKPLKQGAKCRMPSMTRWPF